MNMTSIYSLYRMNTIPRLLSMMTIQNLILLLFFKWYPSWFQDILRGTSLMIMLMVVFTWTSVPMFQYYVHLFRSFPSFLPTITDQEIIIILTILDFIFHFLPILLIGIPHFPISLLIGYGLLCIWFILFGKQIHHIYIPGINEKQSLYLTGIVTFFLFLFY